MTGSSTSFFLYRFSVEDVVLDFALGRAGVEDAKVLSRYDSQPRTMHS